MGFTTDSKQVPSQEQIDALLERVDYSKIQLDGTTLTMPKGMQLDLGAVGKGYTADLVAEVLQTHGVQSALINLGGNIRRLAPGLMAATGASAFVPLGGRQLGRVRNQ